MSSQKQTTLSIARDVSIYIIHTVLDDTTMEISIWIQGEQRRWKMGAFNLTHDNQPHETTRRQLLLRKNGLGAAMLLVHSSHTPWSFLLAWFSFGIRVLGPAELAQAKEEQGGGLRNSRG